VGLAKCFKLAKGEIYCLIMIFPANLQQLIIQVKLVPGGGKPGSECSYDTARKMYEEFLDLAGVKINKKLHLPRKTMPGLLEDYG